MWPVMYRLCCGNAFLGASLPLRSLLLLAVELAIGLGLIACGSPQSDALDTPTSGYVRIAADQGLRPALDPVLEQFHRTYPRARVEVCYLTEAEAVAGLLRDSFRVAIVCRPFTKEDSISLVEQRIRPKQLRLVREGIAVIGHPLRRDSLLSIDTLIAWLRNPRSPYTFVIEGGAGSGIFRYVRDTLLRGAMPSAPLYRADSTPAVIRYVEQHPRAMGLISVAWVCDREDSTTQKFLRSVRLFALANSGSLDFYYPYAGYLRPGFYPLARDVYALSREPRLGLGSGFISYAAGPDGQRIFLKSELLPAIAPVRIVELREEKLFDTEKAP
ncbi:MAG: substrate-binding domain-containing protein [Bacteroidia bacterium]|nr:substrate-binding domain-containing protein [Bacteroidia bacterium]